MKKPLILVCLLFAFATSFNAQEEGIPANPEPGKCYIGYVTPTQYETLEKRVLLRPAYKTLTRVPAEYRAVDERVLIKEASKKFIAHPAVYKTVPDTVQIEDPFNEITIIPTKFGLRTDSLEVRPKLTRMEWQFAIENCKSVDPRDCMVLRNVEHPAEFRRINSQVIERDATFTRTKKGGRSVIINRQVVEKEAWFETVEIPAEYQTISKMALVKDEVLVETEVPAEYSVETVEVLKDPGGVEKWEEIDCSLTENNPLPINYELGSAVLNAEARYIIDSRLLNLMLEKPNLRIEVAAHTDSRGAAAANQSLSQARADAVVSYLVSRGVERNRLVPKGYGETMLTNNCGDGVICSEDQHAQNRRTEFRVLSN